MLKITNSQVFEERGYAMLSACEHAETAKLYKLRDEIIDRQRRLNEEMRRLIESRRQPDYSQE